MVEVTELIGKYSFPIAVCAFLLWERSTTIVELRKTIEANTMATVALTELIRRP